MGTLAWAIPVAMACSTIATAAAADVVHLQCQMQPRGGGAPYDKTLSIDASAASVVDDGVTFTAAGREVREVSADGVPVVRVFKVSLWSSSLVAWGEEFYSGGRRVTGGDVRYQLNRISGQLDSAVSQGRCRRVEAGQALF